MPVLKTIYRKAAAMYETLQSIVDQLEFCEYQTKDGLHDLKMNAAFIALKERAAAEHCGSKTGNIAQQPQGETCAMCGGDLRWPDGLIHAKVCLFCFSQLTQASPVR
jgi:hypothetical protein